MLELRGADQLTALSAKLKAAGNRGLQRELSKGISKAVQPFKAAVAESASSMLPSSGGLAGVAAAASVPRVSRSANGVRMVAKGKGGLKGLAQLNAGSVRHPVFNRGGWSTQAVTAGFWDRAVEQVTPEVRKQLELAVAEIAKQIGA